MFIQNFQSGPKRSSLIQYRGGMWESCVLCQQVCYVLKVDVGEKMKMRNMVMHTSRIPMMAVWEIPKAVVGYSFPYYHC